MENYLQECVVFEERWTMQEKNDGIYTKNIVQRVRMHLKWKGGEKVEKKIDRTSWCLSILGKYNSPLKQITRKVERTPREHMLKAYTDWKDII